MTSMTNRRCVLHAALAGATSGLLPRASIAATGVLHRRPAVHTTEGMTMLAIYADGVRALMDKTQFAEADPRSWIFQWYTHSVPSNTGKAAEQARVFAAGDSRRSISEAMWDTCEAHTDASRSDFFLPWHRMYVSAFENIIRSVTSKPDFSLPYWDYTDPTHRSLPAEFRLKDDPKWKTLYRPTRLGTTNNGKNIDSPSNAAPLNVDALRSPTYSDSNADAGFCANLDGTLHGAVHVDVGNGLGMGSVPYAAQDPIFWLHHCNIDRMWASWNKAGGKNPDSITFLAETFRFANPAGAQIEFKVADFLTMPDYEYDAYVDRPPRSPSFSQGPILAASHAVSGSSGITAGAVSLQNKVVRVRLAKPLRGSDGTPLPAAATSLDSISPEARLYLRLEGLTAHSDPGSTYDVYVTARPREVRGRSDPAYVGSLPFFGIGHQHGRAAPVPSAARLRNVSFLLNEQMQKELKESRGQLPYVTIVRSGAGAERSVPTVGRIALTSA